MSHRRGSSGKSKNPKIIECVLGLESCASLMRLHHQILRFTTIPNNLLIENTIIYVFPYQITRLPSEMSLHVWG
jgi:hypothetical protein